MLVYPRTVNFGGDVQLASARAVYVTGEATESCSEMPNNFALPDCVRSKWTWLPLTSSPPLFSWKQNDGRKCFQVFAGTLGNAFPRCFDVSLSVSHMRDENFLFSCPTDCDRSYLFEIFKNILYFLVSFGSGVVSDSLCDLLADVSHLGLVFSVHIFRLSTRAKSSWSLVLIVSSLRAGVTAVSCSNISVSSFVIAVVAACLCSSISAASCAAAVALVACWCSSSFSFLARASSQRHSHWKQPASVHWCVECSWFPLPP